MQISEHGHLLLSAIAADTDRVSTNSLIHQWLAAEADSGVRLATAPCQVDYPLGPDPVPDQTVHNQIFPFMDRTGLIITGEDLQSAFTLIVDGFELVFSFREWGAHMAEWMIRRHGTRFGPWKYLDFYDAYNAEQRIAGYSAYLGALYKLVDAKERMLSEEYRKFARRAESVARATQHDDED